MLDHQPLDGADQPLVAGEDRPITDVDAIGAEAKVTELARGNDVRCAVSRRPGAGFGEVEHCLTSGTRERRGGRRVPPSCCFLHLIETATEDYPPGPVYLDSAPGSTFVANFPARDTV